MGSALVQSWHYIAGLATIGAVSALAATGTVPGADALPAILAVGGALVGGGIATLSGNAGSKAP